MLTKRDLQIINRDGNASGPYESEDKDDWRPEASYTGKDCDSYASWKKRKCLRKMVPSDQMCIATCWVDFRYTPDDYHAVLLVHLEGEILVLDNRQYFVNTIQHFREFYGYDFDIVPQYIQDLINHGRNAE